MRVVTSQFGNNAVPSFARTSLDRGFSLERRDLKAVGKEIVRVGCRSLRDDL